MHRGVVVPVGVASNSAEGLLAVLQRILASCSDRELQLALEVRDQPVVVVQRRLCMRSR